MNRITRFCKKIKVIYIQAAAVVIGICLLAVPIVATSIPSGKAFYNVKVNGKIIGLVENERTAQDAYIQARAKAAQESQGLVLIDADYSVDKAEKKLFSKADEPEKIQDEMYKALKENMINKEAKAYTIKINEFTVTVGSKNNVIELLESAKNKYDTNNEFTVELVADSSRELGVLTTNIVKADKSVNDVPAVSAKQFTSGSAGLAQVIDGKESTLDNKQGEAEVPDLPLEKPQTSDIQQADSRQGGQQSGGQQPDSDSQLVEAGRSGAAGAGAIQLPLSGGLAVNQEEETMPEATGSTDGIRQISFGETVEVVEAYVPKEDITPVEEAIDLVTKDKEKNVVYEVVPGDCLSVVAEKNNTSVSNIVHMNEALGEDTIIQAGDEIVVTVPEPELSVQIQEETTYDEEFQAEPQYVDNDSWFTNQEEVRQEAVLGHRSVTALITYRNGKETGREVVAETVTENSIPLIIERGTQTPPTYIKPLSGGTFTSGFKQRWGRQHKGIDWACPTGTAIKASNSGTVTSAGWSNGYGYCVTIQHSDGKQTRYGHLSKVLVSAGQKVSQGDKIALSGNTGRSTGPHVHFEIIVGGSQVNPFEYLN